MDEVSIPRWTIKPVFVHPAESLTETVQEDFSKLLHITEKWIIFLPRTVSGLYQTNVFLNINLSEHWLRQDHV